MKKLVTATLATAALVVPALPATADEDAQYVGRKSCQWGEVGTVIWHDTPVTEYEEIRFCIPRVPPPTP